MLFVVKKVLPSFTYPPQVGFWGFAQPGLNCGLNCLWVKLANPVRNAWIAEGLGSKRGPPYQA